MNSSEPQLDVSMLPIMKIHDWFDGPYPARVRIALAEKGMLSRIEFVSVNLWKGEHKKPEFLAINYSGTLPVLELNDGTLIAECTAITQYLDVLDGSPILTGQTPVEKGLIHMMTKRAEIEFLDAVSVYFHHATPGLGPQVELSQNAEWGVACATRRSGACTISIAFSNISLSLPVTRFRWPILRFWEA